MKKPNWISSTLSTLAIKWIILTRIMWIPRWTIVSHVHAMIYGWNEMVKNQTDLGRKVMCRSLLGIWEITGAKMGIADIKGTGNPVVLEIEIKGEVRPIIFRESDWELMREALRKHDEEVHQKIDTILYNRNNFMPNGPGVT